MSVGGGKSKSSSSQQSASESKQFGTDIWGPQSPYLQDLYARAQSQLGQQGGIDQANQFQTGASNALDYSQQVLRNSNQALGQFLQPGQDPAVSAYATNLGQQFQEQFLPGLRGDAALAGGLGGSRQQIGQALGAQRAMQTLGDFSAQTYAGQQERALQAAQGIGQNALGFQNAATAGMGMADFARSMPWYNLSQFQGLLGAPVMRDLGGYSTSTSSGKSKSGSFNFNAGLGGG